jgi:hypothetical protein
MLTYAHAHVSSRMLTYADVYEAVRYVYIDVYIYIQYIYIHIHAYIHTYIYMDEEWRSPAR